MLEAGNTQVNQRIMPEDFEGTFDGNGHTISGIYMPFTDGNLSFSMSKKKVADEIHNGTIVK